MKKSIAYPLIALLILSLLACGVLFMDRQSLIIRLQSAEEQMGAAQEELGALLFEKDQWTQEKKAVGKTIGTVKTVLIDTLKELDEVTDVFGGAQEEDRPALTAMPDGQADTPSPAMEEDAAPAPTLAAGDMPALTAAPSPTPLPAEKTPAPKADPAALATPEMTAAPTAKK